MKKNLLTSMTPYIATAIVSVAISAIVTNELIKQTPLPPAVVKVDLQALIREKTDEVARQSAGTTLTAAQQESVDSYTEQLNTVIERVAKTHNLIVVPSQAVVAGSAQDITPVIQGVIHGK